MKRYFLYSAVTQFDTTNSQRNPTTFGGAGQGVISGFVSSACAGLRFGTPCNYLFRITSREAAMPVRSTVVVRVGR
jgi:hypothetical protein